jgi:hypothetical protein
MGLFEARGLTSLPLWPRRIFGEKVAIFGENSHFSAKKGAKNGVYSY